MPKVLVLRNTGTKWHKEHGVPLLEGNKGYEENKEYDVSKDAADILIKQGLAEMAGTFRGVPEAASIRGVPPEGADESPVSDANADEAIGQISNMRSKDKLQHIVDTDKRVTVKEAAKKRIEQLNG